MRYEDGEHQHKSLYCSVVLPVYNEEEAITNNLVSLYLQIEQLLGGKTFEIIIADNASTDKTKSLVEAIVSTGKNIVYDYIPCRGRGGALAKGFCIAKGEYVAVLSIDRAWNEVFLPQALSCLELGTDIVYGPKDHPDSLVSRPINRKIGSFVTRVVMTALFNKKLPDTQCIKVFRAESIPFLNELGNYNYFAEADFALRANLHEISCKYLPVEVKDFRKLSKVKLRSLFEFISEARHFRKYVWSAGLNEKR